MQKGLLLVDIRDGADNKKCIRMLHCVCKPCSHAAPLCKLGVSFDYTKGMFCTFVLGLHPSLSIKIRPNLVKTFFFWSSSNFGQKIGPNLTEDLFLALLLILGKKSD